MSLDVSASVFDRASDLKGIASELFEGPVVVDVVKDLEIENRRIIEVSVEVRNKSPEQITALREQWHQRMHDYVGDACEHVALAVRVRDGR